MKDPIDTDRFDLFQALGHLVFEWNAADECVRGVLGTLITPNPNPDSYVSTILTAELGNRDLLYAMRAYAWDEVDTLLGAHLEHLAVFYERLSQHRNHYVHGISSYKEEPAQGVIMKLTAKSKVRMTYQRIPLPELDAVTDHCVRLRHYANGLARAIRAHLSPDENTPAWPDTPTLPPLLGSVGHPMREPPPRPPSQRQRQSKKAPRPTELW